MNVVKIIPAFCLALFFTFISPAQQTTNDATATLKQYLSDFQSHPGDAAQKKIIALVATMNPKPEIPEEARHHGIMATTLEKDAKEPADYDLVLKEYDAALAAAPWWPEALVSKSKAAEARGKYRLAMDTLKLYLLTKPDGGDARTAQDKIYSLEAKLVKENAEQEKKTRAEAEARAEQQRREQQEQQRKTSLEGDWERGTGGNWDGQAYFRVSRSGNKYVVVDGAVRHSTGGPFPITGVKIKGGHISFDFHWGQGQNDIGSTHFDLILSDDGMFLDGNSTASGMGTSQEKFRRMQ